MPHRPPPIPASDASGRFASVWASCLRFDGEHGRSIRIVLAGELDIASVPRVDRVLRRAAADVDAGLLVLDLRQLWFMDCSGAHLIVETDRGIRRAGGQLVVVRGPERIDWFFGLLGLDRQLDIVDEPPPGAAETELLRSVAA